MVGSLLDLPFSSPSPLPTLLHPVLCPGRSMCKDHISGMPCPLDSSWVLPLGGREKNEVRSIYSLNLLLSFKTGYVPGRKVSAHKITNLQMCCNIPNQCKNNCATISRVQHYPPWSLYTCNVKNSPLFKSQMILNSFWDPELTLEV